MRFRPNFFKCTIYLAAFNSRVSFSSLETVVLHMHNKEQTAGRVFIFPFVSCYFEPYHFLFCAQDKVDRANYEERSVSSITVPVPLYFVGTKE